MAIDRIYWDTVVFVYRIQERPEQIESLRRITNAAEAGEVEIATSTFTCCETASLWSRDLSEADQETIIRDFFDNPYIILQQVTRDVGQVARQAVRSLGVKGKDAVHVASAILAGCSELQTYDERLLRKSGQFGAPPLLIRKPEEYVAERDREGW